jgi:hypothetical protein
MKLVVADSNRGARWRELMQHLNVDGDSMRESTQRYPQQGG